MFTRWVIVHWVVAEWKSNSTFFCNSTRHCSLHHCVCYTQDRMSSERTCTSIHSLSCYKPLYWCEHYCYVMVYVANIILRVWSKCWTSLCYRTKHVFQNQIQLPLTYTLCVTFPTHNCPHMTENSDIRPQEYYQWQFSLYHGLKILIRKYSWCKQ
jgi:hypothetical protein